MTRLLAAAVASALLCPTHFARASEVSGGPYCGVYSVFAALNAVGIRPEFAGLLEPKYLGGHAGSTLAELRAAVEDHGGHALPLEGLSAAVLRNSPHPIVLHVRRPGHRMPYRHWVVFLGMEDGQARVLDPPNAVDRVPLPELLSLWDGVGLVVSATPVSSAGLRLPAWVEQLAFLAVVGAAALALRQFAPRPPTIVLRLGLVAALALGCGLAFQAAHPEGVGRNPAAAAQVVGLHFQTTVPEIDADAVARELERPGVVLFDARFPDDYAAGHLPGAVSLPVYAGLVERSRALAAVPSDARVIVYCQSENCVWGDTIAADIRFRGYDNVAVYRGGWYEWSRRHGTRQAKPSNGG